MAIDPVTISGPQPGLTREQSARARGECPAPGHCVLRAEGVEKAFHRGIWPRRRTVEVLKGASLMVCKGELVGLVGENGSGKSTLMQIIVGLQARDSGRCCSGAIEMARASVLSGESGGSCGVFGSCDTFAPYV
jgi:ABC-type glutathione transport system ATPase component